MAQSKVIRLSHLLADVAGQVALFGDRVDDVLSINADEYDALQAIDPKSDDIAPYLAIVRRVMPALTKEEVGRLTMPAIGAIIAVAKFGVAEVQEQLPNSLGATTTTETPSTLVPAEVPAT